jgi:hypothetical protein
MNTLERRITRLEAVLRRRKSYAALRRLEILLAEERTERPEPILRKATLRAAPQGEAVRVEPPPESHPEEPSEARRQGAFERLRAKGREGCEPARPPPPAESPKPEPPLVQPFTYDPPSEMQIRPVTWRRRDARDYDDDPDDMYGKCIVDYDPLAQEDADYDDDDP